MTTCAVVQNSDNVVVNMIVAEPTDPPMIDCYLVEIKEGMMCNFGWIWDGTNFIDPSPPAPIESVAAEPVVNSN